jgi:hypothetical protein
VAPTFVTAQAKLTTSAGTVVDPNDVTVKLNP